LISFPPVLRVRVPTSVTFQLSAQTTSDSTSTLTAASTEPRREQEIRSEAATTTVSIMKAGTADCFREKTVLLTGASGGLGRSLALELAACGVGTLILSARRKDALQEVAAECQSLSNNSNSNNNKLQIHILTCDLGDPASVTELGLQAVKVCPNGLDVLINNGGVSSRSSFVETDVSVDQKLTQINFLAGAALTKAVVPGMIQQGHGRIVWISSVQGLLAVPGRTSYAGLGYCDSLRPELAGQGVTVHVISPGYIRTNLSLLGITGNGKAYGKMDETTAQGANPKDVAIATLDSVAANQAELLVTAGLSAQVGTWLRFSFPGLLRYLLAQRFEKSQAKEKKNG
jgi:short-subunit dehydrogenase